MHGIPPVATLLAVAKKKRKRVVEPVTLKDRDLLWDYARLSHLYGLVLIGVSLGLLLLSVVLEATSEDGWSWVWLGVVIGVAGITGLVFLPLLSVWLKRSGLASIRLPDAQQADGGRLLEAGDRLRDKYVNDPSAGAVTIELWKAPPLSAAIVPELSSPAAATPPVVVSTPSLAGSTDASPAAKHRSGWQRIKDAFTEFKK